MTKRSRFYGLDGNHKLIHWRMVIHGGIDSFSRLITFVQCFDNNCSEIVLDCCEKASLEYGIPSHVRTDCGAKWNK